MAFSLDILLGQLNESYPNRSKISDGGIGDVRHISKKSDHNPWVRQTDSSLGIVTARDFTHDPKRGLDCNQLAERLIDSRDDRIKYIIWNGKIISSTRQKWRWRKYSGSNQHTKHLHLSVKPDRILYDNDRFWKIFSVLTIGSRGLPVEQLQEVLKQWQRLDHVDGIFGKKTEAAVKSFQQSKNLTVDGIAGKQTLEAMNLT